jgi:hypothetical protein
LLLRGWGILGAGHGGVSLVGDMAKRWVIVLKGGKRGGGAV